MRRMERIAIACIVVAAIIRAAPSDATPTLCAIGDSLAVPEGWPSKLPAEWKTTVLGIPGTMAIHWWQQYQPVIDECAGSDAVTVNLGSNDRMVGFSPEGFAAWLTPTLARLTSEYETVLLWQVMPYLDVTTQLCAQYGLTCLDQSALLDREHYRDPTNLGGWEGIHPNDAGQQIMADAVVQAVPEASTLMAFGTGLAMLGAMGTSRHRRKVTERRVPRASRVPARRRPCRTRLQVEPVPRCSRRARR